MRLWLTHIYPYGGYKAALIASLHQCKSSTIINKWEEDCPVLKQANAKADEAKKGGSKAGVHEGTRIVVVFSFLAIGMNHRWMGDSNYTQKGEGTTTSTYWRTYKQKWEKLTTEKESNQRNVLPSNPKKYSRLFYPGKTSPSQQQLKEHILLP